MVGVPLFSAFPGHTLLERTPWHAWTEHPDLNPAYVPEESEVMDLGTIAHGCLLTGDAAVVLVDAPDWRTKAAREARDAARAAGKTPLLAHKWAAVQAMVSAARRQLEAHPAPIPFVGGTAEQSLYFELDGVACRATPDWVSGDRQTIVDYKTTSASAHPGVWSKTIWGNGYAFQAALYRRAIQTVDKVRDPDFEWIVQETYPPYALASVALDLEAMEFATLQVTAALALWRRCLETGDWPGYPMRTAYAEVPPWVQAQWTERSYYAA